jgi:hypothetical protein
MICTVIFTRILTFFGEKLKMQTKVLREVHLFMLYSINKCFLSIVCTGAMLLFFSCASSKDLWKPVDAAVDRNNFEAGITEIEKGQTQKAPRYKKNNAISLYLDKGLLEHYAGNYAASYNDLLESERLIEAAYTKSVTQDLASYVANDNSKDYAGEDYEDIYVNIFNALNAYHLNNGQAYALINDLVQQGGELQVLSEKYTGDVSKVREFLETTLRVAGSVFSIGTIQFPETKVITFNNSALARYLGAVFALNEDNKDMARFQLFELQNAFGTPVYRGIPIPKPLAVTGERGSEAGPLLDIPAGKGQLNVLAFAGLSPVKVEELQRALFPFLQTQTLLLAQLKVPALKPRPSAIRSVTVSVEGGEKFSLELLEDIEAVMTDTFNGKQSSVYLKTFIRTVAKYIAADIAAQESIKQGTPELVAAGVAFIAKKALDATEGADVRAARYLPGKAYVGAVDLNPGHYNVIITYSTGDKVTKSVDVKAGKIAIVEAILLK